MNILIRNGHVIDPANQRDEITDIYIVDGLIAALGKTPKNFHADTTLDASNLFVIPGLVDLAAHLRLNVADQLIHSRWRKTIAWCACLCRIPPSQKHADRATHSPATKRRPAWQIGSATRADFAWF